MVFNCWCKSSQQPLAGHTARGEEAPRPQQHSRTRCPPHLASAIVGKWGPGETSQDPCPWVLHPGRCSPGCWGRGAQPSLAHRGWGEGRWAKGARDKYSLQKGRGNCASLNCCKTRWKHLTEATRRVPFIWLLPRLLIKISRQRLLKHLIKG